MSAWRRGFDTLGFHLARLGRPGLFGMLAMVAAGLLCAYVLRVQAQTAALAAQAARLAAIPEDQRKRADTGPRLPVLPRADQAPAVLEQLFAAADRAGLEIDRGEYRESRETGAPFSRYRVLLPVYGSYPAIRGFLGQVMNTNPSLALESVSLRREYVEDTELEARLRFTLYLEAKP